MPDKVIFFSVVSLMTIGVVFTYSLTPFLMVRFGSGEFNFVIKQFFFAFLSIFIIWTISRLEPEIWLKKIGLTLFLGGLFLMVIMNFLPASFIPQVGGASRWISIFGFSIAPVEFFKIGFVYFIAWSMSRKIEIDKQHKFKSELIIFLPYLLVFIISVFFITVLQKDLGQSVILAGTLLLISYLAGGSGKFIAKLIGSFIAIFIAFILTFTHRTDRIQSWWQMAKTWLPDWLLKKVGNSTGEEPYQVSQALGAIYNGGFWGTGLGNGIFKYGFLSEVHTDFILEGIAEEMGLISIIVIFIIYAVLFQRILRVANRSGDRTYFLFNIGIALIIGIALLINTYGSSGLIPMKGIPVPFISYGGSSMLALSIGIGMVLMTSKKANRDDTESNKPETNTADFMRNNNFNQENHNPDKSFYRNRDKQEF